jgi:hypothetical protein
VLLEEDLRSHYHGKDYQKIDYQSFEGQVIDDKWERDISSWSAVIAVSFIEYYQDMSAVETLGKSYTESFASERLNQFVTWLTIREPRFPSWFQTPQWDFTDLPLQPDFKDQIKKLHDLWIMFQKEQVH